MNSMILVVIFFDFLNETFEIGVNKLSGVKLRFDHRNPNSLNLCFQIYS